MFFSSIARAYWSSSCSSRQHNFLSTKCFKKSKDSGGNRQTLTQGVESDKRFLMSRRKFRHWAMFQDAISTLHAWCFGSALVEPFSSFLFLLKFGNQTSWRILTRKHSFRWSYLPVQKDQEKLHFLNMKLFIKLHLYLILATTPVDKKSGSCIPVSRAWNQSRNELQAPNRNYGPVFCCAVDGSMHKMMISAKQQTK
jgi:hypothetical protein